jgi:hypothetical protein
MQARILFMHQQPFEGLTQFLASVFILYTLYNFVKYSQNPNVKGFSDVYELGYIYDNSQQQNTVSHPCQTVQPKKHKHKESHHPIRTPKPVKPIKQEKEIEQVKKVAKKVAIGYNALQQDCYDSLIALGMKKKEATYVVNSTFNKVDIKTVQEFLQIALIVPKK